MVKVITYGTYDLLHYGHIRLLERAKALGDYLIVGVTSDDYDKVRGKINNQQTLIERIDAVRGTGLADEIIVEEYDGQKIADIKKYGVDVFTLGSDWEGQFDYLNEFCKVVYLPRTDGVSSTEIRSENMQMKLAVLSELKSSNKFIDESKYVNGVMAEYCDGDYSNYDAVYIANKTEHRYEVIKEAIAANKHVLCEVPYALSLNECKEVIRLAKDNNLVLMPSIKTGYLNGFNRMILLAKSGRIGDILSVDVTCTSIRDNEKSLYSWGPIALLPVFKLLGTKYLDSRIITKYTDLEKTIDGFSKIDFIYDNAVASIKVAKDAKSEGELIITGTKGYIYVPAPWWKTDYFETRFENPEDNRRFYYQLDGEGIRYEIVEFANSVSKGIAHNLIDDEIVLAVTTIMEKFKNRDNVIEI